jgi:hypothetical protein
METQPITGEKRTFGQSFPDDDGESRAKKARVDIESEKAPPSSTTGDATDVDTLPITRIQTEGESSRRLRALEERELALNKDLMLLKNGQHPVLAESYKKIESERLEKHLGCDNWKLHHLRQVDLEFDSRKKQVEDEYISEQREVKEKLIEMVKDEKRRLEQEFLDNEKSASQLPKKPKRRGPKPVDPTSRSDSMTDLERVMALQDKDIREDVAQIQKNIQQPPTT